jgi:hypothetical protein
MGVRQSQYCYRDVGRATYVAHVHVLILCTAFQTDQSKKSGGYRVIGGGRAAGVWS